MACSKYQHQLLHAKRTLSSHWQSAVTRLQGTLEDTSPSPSRVCIDDPGVSRQGSRLHHPFIATSAKAVIVIANSAKTEGGISRRSRGQMLGPCVTPWHSLPGSGSYLHEALAPPPSSGEAELMTNFSRPLRHNSRIAGSSPPVWLAKIPTRCPKC